MLPLSLWRGASALSLYWSRLGTDEVASLVTEAKSQGRRTLDLTNGT